MKFSAARLPAGLLHWICCAFLILCVGVSQYLYAAVDKLYFVDHDWWILSRAYAGYDADPSGWVPSSLKYFLSGHARWNAFSSFWVPAHFWAFGRTLAVSKLAMSLPLLCMVLSTYAIAYSVTKKELAGFLAALLSLSLPIVVVDSRTHFPFIPLAGVLLTACLFTIENLDLRNAKHCAALSACMWLGSLVHYSAFLHFLFFFAYLLHSNKDRTRYALMLAVFLLAAAWNHADFGVWLSYSVSHGAGDSWKDHLRNLLEYFRSGDLTSLRPLASIALGWEVVALFALGGGVLLGSRLAGEQTVTNGRGEPGPKLAFLSLFMLYTLCMLLINVVAPFPFKKPPDVVMVFFPLCATTAVSAVFLLGGARSSARPVPAAAAALAVSWVLADALLTGDHFRTQPGLLEVGGDAPRKSCLEDDMADIGWLLSHAAGESGSMNGAGASALACSVTLRGEGRKPWVDDAAPLFRIFPSLDATALILEPQAFFSGTRMRWKSFSLSQRRKDSIWIREDGRPLDLAGIRRGYVFLTVINQTADKGKLWDMPEDRALLAAIRARNTYVHRGLFAGSTLIYRGRLHRNLFLYAFRIRA